MLEQRKRLLDTCMARFITCDPACIKSLHVGYIGSLFSTRDISLLRSRRRCTVNEIIFTCSFNNFHLTSSFQFRSFPINPSNFSNSIARKRNRNGNTFPPSKIICGNEDISGYNRTYILRNQYSCREDQIRKALLSQLLLPT